ncbi:MAG: cell division protein FtsZ [Elusimicrobia bacterium]|nr:cell division protein FtsZ [Elusimicrobiota bacterium]
MLIRPAEDFREARAVIKVVGVGGAGGNAVNRMIQASLRGVEFIASNTDAQVLKGSLAEVRVQLGEGLTKGLGAGGDPMKGREATLESEGLLREYLAGSDLVFITAGMGGGTGTGGAPVVARVAKELGALTIGVVTKPFDFEGMHRAEIAQSGIQEMRQNVDTLLQIPNQRLFDIIDSRTPAHEAFRRADDVLRKAIQSISDVITLPGAINMDLNDIRAIMKDAGEAMIGMAEESGGGRALKAAKAAVESPLLENAVIDGAKGLIVNVTGRKEDLMLCEIEEAMGHIKNAASPDARIKLGKAYDETLGDKIRITVIATGFPPRRKGSLSAARRLDLSPRDVPSDARALVMASTLEELNKPAFMRLKVRKLR